MSRKIHLNHCVLMCVLVSYALPGIAQLSTCVNADLEQGSFVNWTATTGSCCPINSTTPGFVNGRHTIMTGTGTDPNTNGAVSVVAPGGHHSARLGNDWAGAEAEQLSYQINVDSGNALFIYRYAVVLEDPSHSAAQQPRFEIRVYDSGGNPVGCGTYNVVASAGIPGFVSLNNQAGTFVRYKDWTTVGIDLTQYIGQTVTIEFSTGDCKLGGHYGYAYVDCYCSPFRILNDFCVGATSTTLTAPIGFASYQWSNGATTQTVTIPNATVGSTYQCTMTSVTGCTITLTCELATTVIASAYTQGDVCQNPVQFYDNSNVISGSPISQWHWDFGDGTSSNVQSPIHTFPAQGIYNVSLIVTNAGGCTDTIVQNVIISPKPTSDFTANVVCPGTVTSFTDLSTTNGGNIDQWIWDFGDGTVDSLTQSPEHVFQVPGTYTVQLIVADSLGCSDTLLQNVATLPGPVAGFTSPIICPYQSVTFSDTSIAVNTAISDWSWDFGDNTPIINGNTHPVHSYNSTGVYDASLVVTASNGCTDTATTQVIVHALPSVAFVTDTVCLGDSSVFQNLSSIAQGTVVQWEWSFGDNFSSSMYRPKHAYSNPGSYLVRLIATSDMGCVDSASSTAHVWQLPQAGFAVNDSAGCRTHRVQFMDQSSSADGFISDWVWDFGNGLSATSSSPETEYTKAGKFDVNLAVTTNLGCKNDLTKSEFVTVYELPFPDFSFIPYVPNVFIPKVTFFDKSANAAHWWWNFGDGGYSQLQHPEHLYTTIGNYKVTLIVQSEDGCVDSTWQSLEVKDDYAFWIPNSFTPDNDGLNDVFMVKGFGFTDLSISIFNRYGMNVYYGTDANGGWDGTYNGEEAPGAVYVYQISMKDVFGTPHTYNGQITLVR